MPNINGNNNANLLTGTLLDDLIRAHRGNDTVNAGGGNDYVDGGAGHDTLYGDAGADTLLGGEGNDGLYGGADNDVLDGGDGLDWAVFSGGGAVNVNLTTGIATGQGVDTLISIEKVFGSSFADVITGNALANRLEGGDGDDFFFASPGHDEIIGGAGSDTLSYATVSGAVTAQLGGGSGFGGWSNGTIQGVENLIGSAFGDHLSGDADANRIDGGAGDDLLFGNQGADTLIANGGADQLTGGEGADVFVVGTSAASVTVTDFRANGAADVIDLSAFGFDSTGQSAYWTANAAQAGPDYVLTLTGQLGEVTTLTLRNTDAQSLSPSDFISGPADLLPPPPPPAGNGVADDFLIIAEAGGCVVINGFEDGLDQIDLTAMGFDSNFESPDWFGYPMQSGADTLLRFWDGQGEYFEVVLTGFDVNNLDISDFILGV